MRIGIVVFALALLSWGESKVTAQGKARGGRNQNGAQYGWLPSLAEGIAQAKKTGKPIMVVIRCVP